MEEYTSIMKNDVKDIVPRPEGKSVVTSRWIYKMKHATNGSIDKFKARFVVRGFSWREGIDYEEMFTPVTKYASIQAMISIASVIGWRIHQMDVKTTFLNMIIKEEVYIYINLKALRYMGGSIMCAGLRKPCMESRRHPRHGIPGLTDTCRAWASPRVRQILTCNSYLLGLIHSSWCCTLMTCFSQVQRIL